jgi:hypothetical protein
LFYGPYPVSPSIWVESGADEVAARDRDTGPRSVLEFADEAHGDPAREAATVVIGIHAFVVGTPDGAAALRRVLARLKSDRSIWLTDTEAIFKTIHLK